MTDKKSFDYLVFEALCDCVGPEPDDIYDRVITLAKKADKAIAERDARIEEIESLLMGLYNRSNQ